MPRLPAWAWTSIAVSVTATWIVLNLIDAFSQSYSVDPGMHVVMGAVAGASGMGGFLQGKRRD